MRNYLAWGCGALLLGQIVFARQQVSTTSRTNTLEAPADFINLLDSKIKTEWEAIKNKDQKAYGEVLADEYVAVEADGGGERYKWKALSELQQSSVTDYTRSFLKVTPLCPDTAFARYEVFIKFPPKSLVKFEKVLVGEIWIRHEGQWKSLHYQETRVK